jgi:hypothetical protein
MFDATDTEWAPWHVVRSDDKRRARLNVITHLLAQFPYKPPKEPRVKLPERSLSDQYDDQATMADRGWIPTPH